MTAGGGRAGKVATATRGQAARLGRALGGRPAAGTRTGGGAGGRAGGPAGQAAKMPFVLLVVALLGGGLISLLLLNSALNEGSFQLSKLKRQTTTLTDEEQALQRDVDAHSAPDALQRRARELGLVPGGSPVFIGADGKVTGMAAEAEPPPPPPPPPPPSPSAPPSEAAAVPAPGATGPSTAASASAPASAPAPASGPASAPASAESPPQAPPPSQQPTPNPGR
ncbi:septum formation initiator [Streptomyces sp. NPDC002990]